MEEEVTVSKEQAEALLRGEHVDGLLPYRLVGYLAPECGRLQPAATVTNRRVLIEIENISHQKAEVCFDVVRYGVNHRDYGPEVEIEIESKGMPRGEVAALADLLASELDLTPSGESKYERALALSGLQASAG